MYLGAGLLGLWVHKKIVQRIIAEEQAAPVRVLPSQAEIQRRLEERFRQRSGRFPEVGR